MLASLPWVVDRAYKRGRQAVNFTRLRGDLVLTDTLLFPDFGLVEARMDVLRSVFEKVNPRFFINPRDLRVNSTDNLGDLRLTASAFGGLGRVEISPTFLEIRLETLRTKSDWDVAEEFSGLVEEGVRARWPAEGTTSRSVSRFVHLERKPDFDVGAFLRGLVSDPARLDPSKFGSTGLDYGIHVKLTGEDQHTELLIDRSVAPEGSLFLHCATTYERDIPAAKDALRRSDGQMRSLLSAFGVEIS